MIKTSYSQTLSITNVQRDSIYNKIQRGIVNAERVKILQKSISLCDSVTQLKTNLIGLQEIEIETKDALLVNSELIIKQLNSQVKNEKKRGRRRAFWSFLKGTGVGATVVVVLLVI